ncbi:hypothetical protein EDD15DRAFT_2369970 [Pisolithus albus]|nr:hypothetical protein EDD15DRAFT_2369970 [Pisolithus albus]
MPRETINGHICTQWIIGMVWRIVPLVLSLLQASLETSAHPQPLALVLTNSRVPLRDGPRTSSLLRRPHRGTPRISSPPPRHSSHPEPPSRHPSHSETPSKTASRHSSHPSGTVTQHPEPISKSPPRLETPSRLCPRFVASEERQEVCHPIESAKARVRPSQPVEELRGTRHSLEGFVFVSSVVEKDTFELGAGSALREEMPREALGHSLQARLDFWALTRGPGGLATQVQVSPRPPPLLELAPRPSRVSSVVQARLGLKAAAWARPARAHGPRQLRPSREPGQALYDGSARPEAAAWIAKMAASKATQPPSSQPLAPSRDQPETIKGRIMSVKVTHPPPSTSETLELNPEAKLAFETLQVAFETLRVAFEALRATFEQPSRPLG